MMSGQQSEGSDAMGDRRPIKSRGLGVIQLAARCLAKAGISPNAISMSSMVFAALGAGAMVGASGLKGAGFVVLCVFAAVMIQLRLLANLLDGIVAEHRVQRSATGALWNEWPDRVSDVLLIICFGLLAVSPVIGLMFGALAGCVAVGTAYIRELGRAVGAPQMFQGPMAKPQRMALLTVGLLVLAAWPGLIDKRLGDFAGEAFGIIEILLVVMLVGGLVTCLRRLAAIHRYAKQQGDSHDHA